jgi:tRNA threonylcarbamoyladenosine biosynthesis protein TsaE
VRWDAPGPEDTAAAARALAGCIDDAGLVIALIGPLGAGKTAFVKALAAGLGIDPAAVASPTFVIASEYAAPERRLAHVDLYRVESEAELDAVGFPDLLEPGAVVAVEWADRFPGALPADRLELRIERHADPGAAEATGSALRVLHASASGPASDAALACWRGALGELGPTPPGGEAGPRGGTA